MPNATDNANQITAPFAGWLTMLTTSTVATYQDLQLCGPTAFISSPTIGAVQHNTGTGPTITVSGTPGATVSSVEVDVTTAGNIGTAVLQWKVNNVVQATNVTMITTYVLGSTGVTVNFVTGSYVATDVYYVPMTFAPLLDLLPNEMTPTGCVERYARFEAVTSTLGLLFGPTTVSVSGTNAPSLTATGVNAAGVCVQVPAGSYVDYLITPSTRYVGYIGNATGYVIITPTSKGLK